MSRNIHRMGDCNSGGGCVTGIPQSTVQANDKTVCVNGSVGTTHPPPPPPPIHVQGIWRTASGSNTVQAENIPVNRRGDSDTCGHSRVGGSSNVFVD